MPIRCYQFLSMLVFALVGILSSKGIQSQPLQVNVNEAGQIIDSYHEFISISDDGRHIAFLSAKNNDEATHHVPFVNTIYVKDIVTGSLTRVDTSSANEPGNGLNYFPSISGNGRFVAFLTDFDFLVGDNKFQAVLKDLATGTLTRISSSPTNEPGDSWCYTIAVSETGRFVAFDSDSGNLLPIQTHQIYHIYPRYGVKHSHYHRYFR